jgi:hypothetical protein
VQATRNLDDSLCVTRKITRLLFRNLDALNEGLSFAAKSRIAAGASVRVESREPGVLAYRVPAVKPIHL